MLAAQFWLPLLYTEVYRRSSGLSNPLYSNPSDDIFALPHESWSSQPAQPYLLSLPASCQSLSQPSLRAAIHDTVPRVLMSLCFTSRSQADFITETKFGKALGIFKFNFPTGKFDERIIQRPALDLMSLVNPFTVCTFYYFIISITTISRDPE